MRLNLLFSLNGLNYVKFNLHLEKVTKCIDDCLELKILCRELTKKELANQLDNFDLMSLFLIFERRKGKSVYQ